MSFIKSFFDFDGYLSMSVKKILPADVRDQGDKIADAAFQWLHDHPQIYQDFYKIKTNESLFAFCKKHKEFSALLSEITLSENIDQSLLKTGTKLFEKQARIILPILGFYSLPYCYAGARGARVLYHSERLLKDPFNRLIETAQFVFDVCKHDAFDQKSNGILSIIKVRLMHAAARHYTSRMIKDETPVNQQDMVGTLLSFSLLVIRGMRKVGISLNKGEVEGYLYLWNVIGGMLGIRAEYLPTNMAMASKLEAEIRKSEFTSSKEGLALTKSLLESYEANSQSIPFFKASNFVTYFLGKEVSDALGLSANEWTKDLIGLGLNFQTAIFEFGDYHFKDILQQFDSVKRKNGINPAFKFAL